MEPTDDTAGHDTRRHRQRHVAAAEPGLRRRRRAGRRLVPLLLAAVVLAACGATEELGQRSSGGDDAGTVTEDAMEAPAPTQDGADADSADPRAAPPPGAAGDGDPAAQAGPASGRAVIRTARMHIRAEDTAATAERIVERVEDVGGYVAGTDLARDAEGVVSGRFTLRVPSAELTALLDAVDELADSVLERRLDEEDVTTQLSDLDARITNLEAYEEELRQLLGEVRESTTDTEDLLRVFDRVNEVRADIDQATARRAVLADQVAMSTVHLQLSPTPATAPLTDPGWSPGDTARGALATTLRILAGIADTLIRIVVTVLPVVLVLLAPLALVFWLARRVVRARRASGDDTPTATGSREHGAPGEVPPPPGQGPATGGTAGPPSPAGR